MTRFSQHGTFSNRTEGQLLISEVEGPWNIELVSNWTKDSTPHALSLSQRGPWIFVVVIHGSMLCPLDALAEMRRIVQYAAGHLGVIANLLVADPSTEGYDFMNLQYAKIYSDLNYYQRFTGLEEAKSFAQGMLRDAASASPQ